MEWEKRKEGGGGEEKEEDVARKVILRGKGIIDVVGKVFVNAKGSRFRGKCFQCESAGILVRVIEK